MIKWFRSGSPWIWLTGGAVSISMLSVLGLMLLIGWKGLTYFWPAPLYQWQTQVDTESFVSGVDADVSTNDVLIGQLYERKYIPIEQISGDLSQFSAKSIESGFVRRLSIKVANRELYPADFVAILEVDLLEPTMPKEWAVIERSRGGYFFGKPVGFKTASGIRTQNIDQELVRGLAFSDTLRDETSRIVDQEIRDISWQLEKLRLEKRKHQLNEQLTDEYLSSYTLKKEQLNSQLMDAELRLEQLRKQLNIEALLVVDMTGETVEIPLSHILDYWYPNQMTYPEKVTHWGKQVWKFLSENPRDSNSEGGVFPAIFGTVLLVILMSIVVMPLGVVAAIYLHEYAKNNALTRLIRIAVINLA
ncbi:MAG: phosphate ABC transporter, permease protein PstA, partial [Vibrio gallaecicus]